MDEKGKEVEDAKTERIKNLPSFSMPVLPRPSRSCLLLGVGSFYPTA